jgi:diadenosine tetraphosphate (Ap4A) HIT family hydrolase
MKLYETSKTLAFMDIQPTASGHALVIPKYHGAMLHDVPDEYLEELLPIAKKIAILQDLNVDSPDGIGYNVLQNNARIAHQMIDHVHVHLIPKKDDTSGLGVGWPMEKSVWDKVKDVYTKLSEKL